MLTELRVRTKLTNDAMEQRKRKVLTDADHDVLLKGPSRVQAPDGRPLCVYLPGAVAAEMAEAYPVLTTIRTTTDNRGDASGTTEKQMAGKIQRSKSVMSSILGSFESSGFYKYCRLTSWTAKEMEQRWPTLLPLFQTIGRAFEEHVPGRFQAQMKQVDKCAPDWIIDGTPFTTITVNNTYSTGVHQDKGDLDEGFSCLAVARRGDFKGGRLTFPEYRVAVDMQDGDLILMDAHAWHGNTAINCGCDDGERVLTDGPCADCGAERVSVVAYFRTNMVKCGDVGQEQERAVAWAERWNGPRAEQEGAGAA
jgi:hypothetical protein